MAAQEKRRMWALGWYFIGLVSLIGCGLDQPSTTKPEATKDKAAALPESKNPHATNDQPTVTKQKFGDPLQTSATKVSLPELVKAPGSYANKTIQTEGTITSVCQARGCWLELGNEQGTAHVKLGNHKFFVPRTSKGKRAIVQGTVLPAVDKGHCEKEAEDQTGKVAKVELVATGVELF
jgi:hypothetical protein